jgi:hypothetical protein
MGGMRAEREVALGQLADRFGMAGAGAILLLLSVPAFLPIPLPTGIPAGFAMALLGAQIALGARRPWLPGWARRLRLSRAQVAHGLARLLGLMRRAGLRLRRRLPAAVGADGAPRPLPGLALIACGLVIVLPIPFGNQLPSLAVAAIGLGLMRRDGAFILVGYGLTLGTAAWTAGLLAMVGGLAGGLAGLLP